MAPVSAKECITVLAALTNVAPFLSPVKDIIMLISDVAEQVSDNKNQCTYLLKRCTDIFLHVNQLCSKSESIESYRKPLEEFRLTLEKILMSVQRLSKKKQLQRFLQRHDISDSIQENHRSLDGILEIFNIQATSAAVFLSAEHEAARQQDQAQMDKTLERLLKNDEDIMKNLDLQGDQILEAIRGLRDTIESGIESATHMKFAVTGLKSLSKQQSEHSFTPVVSYDWAVSSMEIMIEGEIMGSGAFGTVFTGRWHGTRVAVKQLTQDTPRQMLVREIEIWRKMQHPHVASFFRACIDSNPPLLVSELYTFGNAINYLEKFPEGDRVKLCYEISLGMAFLHNQKVVHGDLKPANVLVDDNHRARIADFGLARVKTSMTSRTVLDTSEGNQSSAGTRAFMSPERLRRGMVTYAADVYAFAMSAYQIMTDETPFQYLPEEDIREVVVVDRERPERPEGQEFIERGLTNEMWELIEECWADERQKRPKFSDIVSKLAPWSGRTTYSNVPLGRHYSAHSPPMGGANATSLVPSRFFQGPRMPNEQVLALQLRQQHLSAGGQLVPFTGNTATAAPEAVNFEGLLYTWEGRYNSKVEEGIATREPVNVLIVGDAKCGRSTLVRSLPGNDKVKQAPRNGYDLTTLKITRHITDVSVYDPQEFSTKIPDQFDNHVCLICFDIGRRDTFDHVHSQWVSYVRESSFNIPIILVGCKKDVRTSGTRNQASDAVEHWEGRGMAEEINAACYIECSAFEPSGVEQVFMAATAHGLEMSLTRQGFKYV